MKTNLFLFRSRFVKILLIIIIFLVTMNGREAYAANRYVDNDAPCVGTACDGTTWEKAWKSFSAIRLSSGDVLYISGGITSNTYNEQLTISTASVTVRPGAAESSPDPTHSGTVIIPAPSGTVGIRIAANNVTVDGSNASGDRKILITSSGGTGAGTLDARTGVIIRYLEITGAYNGIRMTDTDCEVDHCYVHAPSLACDNGMGFYYTPNRHADRALVHHNIIEVEHNASNLGADGIQASCCTTAWNNVITSTHVANYTGDQHPDAFQSLGSWTKAWNNVVSGFPNWGFGWLFCNEVCYAFNNYFYDSNNCIYVGDREGSLHGNLNDIRFENNTIVDCIPGTVGSQIYVQPGHDGTPHTATNVVIRNNIVINCPNPIRATAGTYNCGTDVIIDHNITVAGSRGGAVVRCQNVEYQEPTYYSHTQPTFINYVPNAGASNNMRLAGSDTIAKDRGANLSTHFTTDKDGVSRPQGSAWDIGAYEYTTTESRPRPPQNLRVISP